MRSFLTAAALLAAGTMLTGCGSYQKTYAAVAAAVCGAAGSSFKGTGVQRAFRGAGGAAACGAIGAAIGQVLDERDQLRAQQATMQVLRQRLPPQFYQASYAPGDRYASAGGYTPTPNYAPRNVPGPAAAPGYSPDAPDAPGRLPGLPRAAHAQWVSDHSGATGSSAVVAVQPATAEQGECRTVQENAAAAGQALPSKEETWCQSKAGNDDWQKI